MTATAMSKMQEMADRLDALEAVIKNAEKKNISPAKISHMKKLLDKHTKLLEASWNVWQDAIAKAMQKKTYYDW